MDFFLSPHIFPPSQPVCLARLLERLGSHASRRNRPACAVSTCSFAPSYEDALRPSLSPICDSISRCPTKCRPSCRFVNNPIRVVRQTVSTVDKSVALFRPRVKLLARLLSSANGRVYSFLLEQPEEFSVKRQK